MGRIDDALERAVPLAADVLAAAAERGRPEPADLRDELARALSAVLGWRRTVIPRDTVRPGGAGAAAVDVDIGVRGRVGGRQVALLACAAPAGEEEARAAADAAWRVAGLGAAGRADAYLVMAAPPGLQLPSGPLRVADVAAAPMGTGWELRAAEVAEP